MLPRRMAFPVFLMLLIALFWTVASFLLGTAEAAAQGFSLYYNARIVGLVVAPETPPSLYALARDNRPWDPTSGPTWSVYRSRDGGRSWMLLNMRGLEGIHDATSLAIDYRNPGVLYVAAAPIAYNDHFLYRSVNGGDWERLGGPIPGLRALAVDLKDSNVIYAGARYSLQGGFIRSVDGGRSWAGFDRDWPDPSQGHPPFGMWRAPVERILVDPVDPEILYAVSVWSYRHYAGRLLRGDRDGNWVEMAIPATGGGVLGIDGIAFDPRTRSLYLGSGPWGGGGTVEPTARKLWRSDNPAEPDPSRVTWSEVASFDLGRAGWQAFVPSVDPLAIDAQVGTTIYVQTHAADCALWRSDDGGRGWSPLAIPRPLFDAPATDPRFSWTSPATGHTVSGEWLRFLKAHGDTDNLGYPRSDVIADPMAAGQTVQYFQRLILEWHPENPPQYRIQRRLLGDILYPGADPPLDPDDLGSRPQADFHYFVNGPGIGLGHYVADHAPDGTVIYFKEHFDSHGGVDAFGFPKEEPKLRDGRWTQRFQAAVFEHHPEHDVDGYLPGTDIPWRSYRVQLELLGDRYIEANRLTYR